MFTASAELYDVIYSSFKDYADEADRIVALLRSRRLHGGTLLDVGCGTGEHVRLLVERGFEVQGLDLDPELLKVAARKNPTCRFHEADMCAFDLADRFDAVLCLFSSIGYARTPERLVQALRCFRRHLAEGGTVVIEPWFTPEAIRPGHTTSTSVDAPPLRIVRTSTLEVVGRISRLTFDYEITGPEGTSHATELHELGLFTVGEMKGAFAEAGLAATWDPDGLTGRGLYVGRAA